MVSFMSLFENPLTNMFCDCFDFNFFTHNSHIYKQNKKTAAKPK